MSQTDTWTIGRLLGWTTDFLKARGAETARLDAELLLAHARGCDRIELYTAYGEEASQKTRTVFRELVRRRADGAPVAYLLGRREFYSLSFHVSPDVLIPRPETELVVVELLDRAAQYGRGDEPLRIADVGTGSGVLAICAAKHLPGCHVTAVEICSKALDVARKNAAEHGVADRIDFFTGDLLGDVPAPPTFDFIVSNPPYVSEAELETLAPEVRKHEPRLALVAGPNGTEIIARLIPQAAERLATGGWLIMEVSPMIEARVREMIAADGRFDQSRLIKDLSQLPRVVACRYSGA
jgi:release factor glutamine methyltransferase